MDPISISVSAITLATTVGKVGYQINKFVQQVRQARGDMDGISRELASLQCALELLAEDSKVPKVTVPPNLDKILENCEDVLLQFEKSLEKFANDKLTTKIHYVWSGKDKVDGYRNTLAAHKGALDLALHVISMSITQEIRVNTVTIMNDTTHIRDGQEELKMNTEMILSEIARLRAKLPSTIPIEEGGNSDFMIQKYLDELQTYTGSVVGDYEPIPLDQLTISEDRKPAKNDDCASEGYTIYEPATPHSYQERQVHKDNSTDPQAEDKIDTKPVVSTTDNPKTPEISRIIDSKVEQTTLVKIDTQQTVTIDNSKGLHMIPSDRGTLFLESIKGFERISLLSPAEQGWRADLLHRMMQIPYSEVAPKNGTSYRKGSYLDRDYDYQAEGLVITPYHDHSIQPTLAWQLRWCKEYSMSTENTRIKVMFTDENERKYPISPVMAAVFLSDTKWLFQLIKKDAKLTVNERVPQSKDGSWVAVYSTITIALYWNAAFALQLVEAGAIANSYDLLGLAEILRWHVMNPSNGKNLQNHPIFCSWDHTEKFVLETSRLFLDYGAKEKLNDRGVGFKVDLTSSRMDHMPPLFASIAVYNSKLVRLYLSKGANPNLLCDNYDDEQYAWTPLHFAVWLFLGGRDQVYEDNRTNWTHQKEIILMLVEAGASVHKSIKIEPPFRKSKWTLPETKPSNRILKRTLKNFRGMSRSIPNPMSVIELAALLGQLDMLNEALSALDVQYQNPFT